MLAVAPSASTTRPVPNLVELTANLLKDINIAATVPNIPVTFRAIISAPKVSGTTSSVVQETLSGALPERAKATAAHRERRQQLYTAADGTRQVENSWVTTTGNLKWVVLTGSSGTATLSVGSQNPGAYIFEASSTNSDGSTVTASSGTITWEAPTTPTSGVVIAPGQPGTLSFKVTPGAEIDLFVSAPPGTNFNAVKGTLAPVVQAAATSGSENITFRLRITADFQGDAGLEVIPARNFNSTVVQSVDVNANYIDNNNNLIQLQSSTLLFQPQAPVVPNFTSITLSPGALSTGLQVSGTLEFTAKLDSLVPDITLRLTTSSSGVLVTSEDSSTLSPASASNDSPYVEESWAVRADSSGQQTASCTLQDLSGWVTNQNTWVLVTDASGVATLTLGSLKPGTFQFVVTAVNSVGTRVTSNTVSVTWAKANTVLQPCDDNGGQPKR
jgi:hypothetical protein